jgi:HSP20 family protein
MTFYVQTYPFNSAESRPYRQMARRRAEDREVTLGINVREEDEAYVLSAFVPGIRSDELNIQVLEDVVHIDAGYRADEHGNYLVRELPTGSLTRTLRLPAPLDADHVEADISDGVLTLRLPKAESARPKQIKIQAR